MAGLVQEGPEVLNVMQKGTYCLSSMLVQGSFRTRPSSDQVQTWHCWPDTSLGATVFAPKMFSNTSVSHDADCNVL